MVWVVQVVQLIQVIQVVRVVQVSRVVKWSEGQVVRAIRVFESLIDFLGGYLRPLFNIALGWSKYK